MIYTYVSMHIHTYVLKKNKIWAITKINMQHEGEERKELLCFSRQE